MIVGIIAANPDGIVLSTTVCLAHGNSIITQSVPLVMAWAAAVADRITSWDFITIWGHITGKDTGEIIPFVHACLGITS